MARTARVVAFSTTPEMADEIDRMAREFGSSRSQIMRAAFEHYTQAQGAVARVHAQTSAPGSLNGAAMAAEPVSAYVSAAASGTPVYSLPGLAQVLAHRDEIRAVCEGLGVRRLWLFGSAVRDDFEPGRSDFDFQVEWEPGSEGSRAFSAYLRLKDELAALLMRKVDLVEAGHTKNPYVRAAIEAERLVIHDATG